MASASRLKTESRRQQDSNLTNRASPMLGRLRKLVLFFGVSIAICSTSQGAAKTAYSKDQQLVIAAFELDVERVKILLADGANPDARLGFYDKHLFEDKWSFGYSHIGSDKWTPLLAVANSHREPQPDQRAENTIAGREAAMAKLKAIDQRLIAERDSRRIAIAKLLIGAKANLDLDDGYGATALSASVYNGFEELSLLLISSNAKLDTKTGVYIDGDGDITPIHRAAKSPKVLHAMIQRGANVNVADTSGETPLHWAVRDDNVESVKLLIEAGANVAATDKAGRSPSYWCKTYDGIEFPGDEKKRAISKLLDAAPQKGKQE